MKTKILYPFFTALLYVKKQFKMSALTHTLDILKNNIRSEINIVNNTLKEENQELKNTIDTLKEENTILKNRMEQMENRMNALMEFIMLMK